MFSERSERETSAPLRSRRHPDYLMRATWHDYRRPAAYLVTFSIAEDAPHLSHICGEIVNGRTKAATNLTPPGALVEKSINSLPSLFSDLEVLAYSIMPDHVHIVLRIYRYVDYTLGRVVAKTKGLVSAVLGRSIWKKGFNDKISLNREKTSRFIRYVDENPLRFYVRISHPEYFVSKYKVKIQGREYAMYGNPMLLNHPLRSNVRFSRRYSPEKWKECCNEWNETIRQGGVLISPFIHPQERMFRELGIELGASIIQLRENGFPERFKPEGSMFDLCAVGRLLIIAPLRHETRTAGGITRRQCLEMNQLAELLSGSVYQREYMR